MALRHTLAAAAFLLGLAAGGGAFAQAPPAGNVEHGHALFLRDGCYECHGTVGQGGSAGARLAPDTLPAEAIQAYVRQPAGQMPPYSPKVLSDQDIVDIQAYLVSLPKPPPANALPLLSQP